ncbi:monosaccharide ABC transporter substrate-binding protein, CUT2 family [Tindallia magadiensis]|uniref:Monosaccharide ABC transporter substrate-binding protein, CUT2 family n=1 Tax=Tindallia magadiensis TaxID=69895 RepID=A0A1I3D5W3_9FIRM|nr:sugar ABC transporter substrate-binding protein [Tindallia magadiensis]SFH82123.1 monosaccharide ABC transporter substrate-binding protein, CUT2 family [Tindallia magadiensis]
MKRKIGILMLAAIMMMTVLAGCGNQNEAEVSEDSAGMVVGMAVQDLSNPIWSGAAQALQALVEANGGEMSYVACDSNVATQIEQVENFIARGVDALVIHAADPAGIETVLAEAREAGIKVYAWDDNLENADIAWLIDNYELGYMIGEHAAAWVNDHHGGEAEVAVLNYPQLPILLERGNGIVDAIEALAPGATIVAEQSAINVSEGQSVMESVFQAYPDVKVVAAIGGGGAVGANEAAKGAGKLADDFGIFAADATEPEIAAMQAGEGNRMSVLITGGAEEIAEEIYYWLEKLVAGEEVEREVYRELIPVTQDNLEEHGF